MKIKLIQYSAILLLFLAALDATAVTSILPAMIKSMRVNGYYSWIIVGFIIAQTAAMPLFGKIFDHVGGYATSICCILLFAIGSYGVANTLVFDFIILSRVIQGFGAGGIVVLCYTLVAITSAPEERLKKQVLISSVWGLASIIGPLAGIMFTKYFSWQVLFLLNIPFCIIVLVAFSVLSKILNSYQHKTQNTKLNYFTSFLFIFALIDLLFICNSIAGDLINKSQIAIMCILFIIFALLTRLLDNKDKDFIISKHILKDSQLTYLCFVNFLASFILYSGITMLPFFWANMFRTLQMDIAFIVMSASLGWVTGSAIAPKFVTKNIPIKLEWLFSCLFILGSLILILSLILFKDNSMIFGIIIAQLVNGVGMGGCAALTLARAQNLVEKHVLGSITSGIQLSRSLGAAIGIALLSTLQVYLSYHSFTFANQQIIVFLVLLLISLITACVFFKNYIKSRQLINLL